jgi:hypothetical protein
MPATTAPAPPLTVAKPTGGTDRNSGFSIATSATGFTTDSGISQDDLALVANLQQMLVHAPPGARPTWSGLRPLTKTQLSAEHKATKEAKAIAADEKRSAVAARKADMVLKRQQRLINSVEVKAAKATAKAAKLRLQLAAAALAGAPPLGPTSHSHKKSKGSLGSTTTTLVQSTPPQQSPQRKVMTANKRVSVFQSPLRSPFHSPEGSTSGSDTSSGSSTLDCPVVGEDSSDGSSQSSLGSLNTDVDGVPPSRASWFAARGSLQDSSPTGRGKRIDQGHVQPDHSAIPNRYRGNSPSSESSEDGEMPGEGVPAPTSDQGMGIETLPHCHRHGLQTSLPPYTNIEDFSLLSQYIWTHFSGNWAAYTAFVHWADSQQLEFPDEPVSVDTWLSMKTPIVPGDPPGAWLLRRRQAAPWVI